MAASPSLRGKSAPTVFPLILWDCALNNNILLGKHSGSASFPTSLLPWFLNCDWQGGSVFPSSHPPLQHGSVKLTIATGKWKSGNFDFKIKCTSIVCLLAELLKFIVLFCFYVTNLCSLTRVCKKEKPMVFCNVGKMNLSEPLITFDFIRYFILLNAGMCTVVYFYDVYQLFVFLLYCVLNVGLCIATITLLFFGYLWFLENVDIM